MSEDLYGIHTEQMIRNIIADETAQIIEHRIGFVDWHHAYSILKEEVEEAVSEVDMLKQYIQEYWQLCKKDAPVEAYIERLELIEHVAENIIHEVKQVGAVAKKAMQQLKKSV